jgi:uncharacterized protein (TIGR02679 family)
MSGGVDGNGRGDVRLQRLLGGDQLSALRRRLRRRFERAAADRPIEHIRIDRLTAEEYVALASLLGRPQRYCNSLQIDVQHLDAALQRAGIASSLRAALERLDGPITNLAAARLADETLWSRVIAGRSDPELAGFLRAPEGLSLLKRLARQDPLVAAELCRRAEAVLRRLPAKGTARSQLAAEALGDAHALDSGQPAATLVLAVWRRLARRLDESTLTQLAADLQPAGACERIRDIWATAGVLVNELARPALFLNMPTKTSEAGCWCDGEPTYRSLRALLRSPPSWNVAGRKVYVCENPNLLAIAADHWGRNCAPLVCTEGMPAAAQQCLLAQLAQAGALLFYHGDFDWPGLRIGNYVMREFGAEPWRFGVTDYIAAVRAVASAGQSLKGKTAEAAWDTALAAAMQQHRLSVAEEALASSLLQDLESRVPA